MISMLKAVIIDDETAAIEALTILIEKHTPEVYVAASTTQCMEGIKYIDSIEPDIVFLDISMPDMSGFALLQKPKYKDFNLVFTTAHERYAIQAIKHHATDYLLKPVDIDELKQAVKMITDERKAATTKMQEKLPVRRLEYNSLIGLPIREGLEYHSVADVLWIESSGNYCTFHIIGAKKYIVSKNIGEYEQLLPEKEFFRVHKSYIVNIKKVRKYIHTDGYCAEMDDGTIIEISRRKKDEFLYMMNELCK